MATLIDFEGIDGSGKGTQAALLAERLRSAGQRVALLSFPRYSETLFGRCIGEFLNGRYGTLDQIHPLLVSLLFAGDRYESRALIQQAADANDVVIFDRYVPSNIAHQASKLDGAGRHELIARIERLEYEVYALPRPDRVLLLDMPPEIAGQLVTRKAARKYTDRAADLQEADAGHLARTREMYLELASQDTSWRVIECCQGMALRTMDAIARDVERASGGGPA